MRCRAVLLKSIGLTSGTGWRTDRHDPYISQFLGETLRDRRNQRTGNTSGETLWRILKGKWIQTCGLLLHRLLLYATNRALAALGSELNINFAHAA